MISITIDGLKEMIAKLERGQQEIPTELTLALQAALLDLRNELARYPEQPAPANPKRIYKRGVGTVYVPTGKTYNTSQRYGTTLTSGVQQEARTVMGYVTSKVSYASFLRGDLDGNGQAWMHKGVWEPLADIVARRMPDIEQRLERAVTDWAERNDL